MFFHYGNCKSKIKELERHNVDLMHQVQELKALYDYQVGILEKDISALNADVHYLNGCIALKNEAICGLQAELGANRCLREAQERENANLQEIVSRKDADIGELMGKAIRLKGEVYGLKQEYRSVQNNEPVAIAERVPHTGEIVHHQYTDGEITTSIDLTKPNSETTIMMGKPMKDEAYYKLLKEIEEKYDIPPEKKPHRKQKKK